MLKDRPQTQSSLEFVCIDELVPQDHLLRKVDKHIDFSFIHELVKDLYCQNNGRPALDPTLMFKLLLLGYLFGVRSERQLIREVEVNVAYRWFLGLGLTDKIPDASTLSQNRRRRFNDSDVYQQIFDQIVLQAMRKKLVSGHVLYTDSTHIKASANKNKHLKVTVRQERQAYMEQLDHSVEEERIRHGKKPLAPPSKAQPEKTIKQSTTDPDSGYMVRDQKPKGFFYLDHRTVDGKANIITDVHITAGNVHDSVPYIARLERQQERFGFHIKAVGLDAGYNSAPICKQLEDKQIFAAIAYRRLNHKPGMFYKREFEYNAESDHYTCPEGQTLIYKTTNREGYHHYQSDGSQCKDCPSLQRCTKNARHVKTVTRHVWQDSKERTTEKRLSHYGKAIYERRKETVERSFADAKELNGYRYARFRGRNKVQAQALLTAAAQNMKKIAQMAA